MASQQKSITSFFGGKRTSETTPENEVKTKNKKYDEKRKRTFIDSWTEQFPWVSHDAKRDVMQCTVCMKYPTIQARNRKNTFVAGCSNFRIEYLKSHSVSDVHLECLSWERSQNREQSVGIQVASTSTEEHLDKMRPIMKAFKHIDVQTLKKLENMFIAEYHVAYRGKPFIEFEQSLDLLDNVGVDIGKKYRNIAGARELVKAIADSLQDEFIPELKQASFLTIMSDGSTDSAVTEQETVFVRCVSQGQPVSFHAATVPLEHAHADGVLDGIKTAVNSTGIKFDDLVNPEANGPNLVCVNFDGASVMLGKKGGVAAKVCAQAEYVVPIHFVAHKLELAVLDAVKHLQTLSDFEDVLKQVFKFYQRSPKMKRELVQVSEVINSDLMNLSDVKQVRWLASKVRSVKALKTSYNTIVTHIESVAVGRTENSAKCQGWLRKMKTLSFVKTVCILLDILPILTEVSLLFRKEDLLIIDVAAGIEGLVMKLLNCKLDPVTTGESMEHFSKVYNHEASTYNGIKLNGVCPPVLLKEDQFLINLVDGVITYLDKRCSCFIESPLKCFSVFDYTQWPIEREALSLFGNDQLSELLEHFSPLFKEDIRRKVVKEFTDLKAHLKGCSRPVFDSYQRLLSDIPVKFVHVSKVVELMFVMSPSTAICERLFSSMNLVKTSQRTVLNQATLCHILTIMTHGPQTLSEFSPKSAMMKWVENTPGTRHILVLMRENENKSISYSMSQSHTVQSAGASCRKVID